MARWSCSFVLDTSERNVSIYITDSGKLTHLPLTFEVAFSEAVETLLKQAFEVCKERVVIG
jgi:hypothetical protein